MSDRPTAEERALRLWEDLEDACDVEGREIIAAALEAHADEWIQRAHVAEAQLEHINRHRDPRECEEIEAERDRERARADAAERELDEANEREQVASSCFAEARADLQQARQQIIREHTDSRYAAGWRAGRADGLRAYAWWKDGTQYVGTTGRTLADALRENDALEPGGDS